MDVNIIGAAMTRTEADGYVGQVQFRVEGHAKAYEITLQSQKGKDWAYGLHFLAGSGSEDDITAVEDEFEDNDELFDKLVDAALQAIEPKPGG